MIKMLVRCGCASVLALAVATHCSKCVDLIAKNLSAAAYTEALMGVVSLGDVNAVRFMRELLVTQRSDGGWSDIPTLPSGAYATGQALVALRNAGLPASNSATQRGVQFLLNTQLEDGSWYVKTRALGFQPYFDNGFPHGVDQWISGAATSWATMALTLSSPASALAKRSLKLQ